MSRKTELSKNIYEVITKTALFACLFFVCCLFILKNYPVEETSIEDVDNEDYRLSQSALAKIDELNLVEEAEELTISQMLQDSLSQRVKDSDESLIYYRNPEYTVAVEWFYTQITGDSKIAKSILTYADSNDVPASLAFALAWTESRYKATAVNRNSNSSIDRGLFQLNSNSFPALSEEDFFDASTSAKYGLSHLKFCLDYAGNEVAALAMYNAGTNRVRQNGTPQVTLNYVSGILQYQQSLNELFKNQVSEWENLRSAELLALLTTQK